MSSGNILEELGLRLEEKREELRQWFSRKRAEVAIPIYGSVDIRDSGFKVAVVDANHFPAGFNNVAEEDIPLLSQLMQEHIVRTHPGTEHIHLYPESHTRNPGYVENLITLKSILSQGGFAVTVGSPSLVEYGSLDGLTKPLSLQRCAVDVEDNLVVEEHGIPDLVILNNDLTGGILPGLLNDSVSPSAQMGWHRRRKSEHFIALQGYCQEVAELLDIDDWHLQPLWFVSEDKCLERESCLTELAAEINEFIARIQGKYDALGIKEKPHIFVKNDRGTYGLGMLTITEGEQLLNLSKRKLHKLTYGKGGALAENFLIQEGVPTVLEWQGAPIEPVVYLVDGEAASWFYRTNSKRDRISNLNSPSAQFITKEELIATGCDSITRNAESWHALVAELSMLAMGAELDYYQLEAS